jgi:hypothetical protein
MLISGALVQPVMSANSSRRQQLVFIIEPSVVSVYRRRDLVRKSLSLTGAFA